MSSEKKTFKERLQAADKKQWAKFAFAVMIILGFLIWSGAWWLLLLIPLALDVYVTKFVPWDGWKNSSNETFRTIAGWVDAILFALVAVYVINLYFFQNYKIPSPSLEKTLKVGDFLFVSKMSYGPRCPMTPLSFPLAQHTLPMLDTKSYIDWPQWEYKRLKGFGTVKRNDIVVFNFPAGDTVALKVQNPDYYTLVRAYGRETIWNHPKEFGEIVRRPVDRRENYVKRCVGLPGDSLQIVNGVVIVNGNQPEEIPGLQYNYFVEMSAPISSKLFEKMEVSLSDRRLINDYKRVDLSAWGYQQREDGSWPYVYNMPLTKRAVEMIKKADGFVSIREEIAPSNDAFPYIDNGWTRDNYGPIWIPKKGATTKLTLENLPLYEQIICNYELNDLKVSDGKILINGKEADSYTFKMDYYWMMGDNRHNSADSRYWGFVPEDHIVGKPICIWLSFDEDKKFPNNIRWDRMFTKVHAD